MIHQNVESFFFISLKYFNYKFYLIQIFIIKKKMTKLIIYYILFTFSIYKFYQNIKFVKSYFSKYQKLKIDLNILKCFISHN